MKLKLQTLTPTLEALPDFVGTRASLAGLYRTGEDSMELFLRGVGVEEYERYAAQLGGTVCASHTIADCRFATVTDIVAGRVLFVGYYPALDGGTLRLIDTPAGALPAAAQADFPRVCPTTLAQLGRRAVDINNAPGMSYVVQVATGEFLIVDGGPTNEDDIVSLRDYLYAHTPDGQRPVIAAWLITHAHSDHMALANHFLERYRDEVVLREVGYNFPVWETVASCLDIKGDPARYVPMIEKFRANAAAYGARQLVLHAGQRLVYADVTVEVLFTHEEQFPLDMPWINHTSLALRLTTAHARVILLGDCEKTMCRAMATLYGDTLKSDVLQLTHHGVNGGCIELYERIDPEICLWAISQTKYESDPRCTGELKGYDFNIYIRDESIRARQHYASSATTVFYLDRPVSVVG